MARGQRAIAVPALDFGGEAITPGVGPGPQEKPHFAPPGRTAKGAERSGLSVPCASAIQSVLEMRVVILAGESAAGSSEETELRPKPMVEVGGRPILWHIMKHYTAGGCRGFVIALGYRGDVIKRYFADTVSPRGQPQRVYPRPPHRTSRPDLGRLGRAPRRDETRQ